MVISRNLKLPPGRTRVTFLHLSVFCVTCNVNGNFTELNRNEGREREGEAVITDCLKCGTV